MKKGMMMGGYVFALIFGLIIGLGLAWYLSTNGMLTSLFCPATAVIP